MTRALRSIAAVAIAFAAAACSDSSTSVDVGSPAAAVAVSGNAQVGDAGTPLPGYLIVLVKDAAGHPLQGVQVTWTVEAGNGTLTTSTSQTDVYGRAIAAWTLGTGSAQQRVVATVAGISQPVVFTATANGQVGIPQ